MTIRNLKNKLKISLLALAAAALLKTAAPAFADDFVKGVRPPTGKQLELMVNESDYGSHSFSLTARPKYFGEHIGVIALLPYTWNSSGNGTGDPTFLFCVLAKQGRLNLVPNYGMTVPAGQVSSKRFDQYLNLFATYFTTDSKKTELNAMLQYKLSGTDSKGIHPPNQFYIGTLAATEIAKGLRVGAGVRCFLKTTGDYQLGFRGGLKYARPKWFVALLVDKVVAQKNMPTGYGGEFQMRVQI